MNIRCAVNPIQIWDNVKTTVEFFSFITIVPWNLYLIVQQSTDNFERVILQVRTKISKNLSDLRNFYVVAEAASFVGNHEAPNIYNKSSQNCHVF